MDNNNAGELTQKSPDMLPFKMWINACLIGLSSFMFGYQIVALNSCLVSGDANSPSACYNGDDDSNPSCPKGTIFDDLNLNDIEIQIATSLVVLGAWIGCFIAAKPSEKLGRKNTLLLNNIFYIIGSTFSASGDFYLLCVGRFIGGLGVGVTSSVGPVLLSEISHESTRGQLTTFHPAFITFGILCASLLAYGFVTYVNHGWRLVQLCGAVPALVMTMFSSWMTESPKWLLTKKNDRSGAVAVLKQIRPVADDDSAVEAEVNLLVQQASLVGEEDKTSWSEVFRWKKAVIIGCGLMFFTTMTGANTVFFYSTTIFGFAGFNYGILATAMVGGTNFVTSLYASGVIDHMGRKTLLMHGTLVMLCSLIIVSVDLLSGDFLGDVVQGVIAVVAVLVYIYGFAIGLGCAAWVVLSEIMPTRLRSKSYSLFVSFNWGFSLLIGLLTLTAINGLGGVKASMDDDETQNAQKNGVGILYAIFVVINITALLFIWVVVPETLGKTPEELTRPEKASSAAIVKSSFSRNPSSSLAAPLIVDVDRSDSISCFDI